MVLLLPVALMAACSNEVEPIIGTEWPFTLYGVLSPQLDTQRVVVFPLEHELKRAPHEPLPAVFTSTDLETSEVRLWQDSLLLEANGDVTHVFWAPFRAEYGHTYRLQAERQDGAVSLVEVSVPPQVEIELREHVMTLDWQVGPRLLIRGEVPRLLHVEVDYQVVIPPLMENRLRLRIPQVPGFFSEEDDGVAIPIYLQWDRRKMQHLLGGDVPLALLDMTLHVLVANEAWSPPGAVFDPEVLARPDQLWNVQEGFGFVGAGYRLHKTWTPPDSILEAARFVVLER